MEKSTEIKEIRRIILDRCAVLSYLDEFEDHCLTLKNAPHLIISCAAYETLVNEEDPTCSTPDTPHHNIDIRRITIKTSPNTIQDAEGHAPHKDSRYAASEDGVRIFQNIIILDPTRS